MADWKLKRNILRAATFLLVLIGALAVYLIYLATVEADNLSANPLNMRKAATQADIQRGAILDAKGRVLAQNRSDGSRSYPMGKVMAAVTGYNGEKIGSEIGRAHV